MKVEVIHRFVEGGVVIRYPGEILDLPPRMAKQLIERGTVKAVETRKRKGPEEDKALRPSEDKKSDEGEGS